MVVVGTRLPSSNLILLLSARPRTYSVPDLTDFRMSAFRIASSCHSFSPKPLGPKRFTVLAVTSSIIEGEPSEPSDGVWYLNEIPAQKPSVIIHMCAHVGKTIKGRHKEGWKHVTQVFLSSPATKFQKRINFTHSNFQVQSYKVGFSMWVEMSDQVFERG